ncbi:MAG: flagellar export protein FliJ, partial [Lachnospiraceae bacterium]|jgi:flagellar FliJ protein|nr:flagellar export protein FliJ [Lachnospiraceae bacterium]
MQNVLDVKIKLEDQARTAFSQAQMRVNEANEVLEGIRMRLGGYEELKRQLMLERLDVLKLNQCENAITSLKYQEQQQMKKIAALNAVLDNARRNLNQAMIDRKTHEKLKENEFEEFKIELNNQEKKEIDELVSFTHNRAGEEDE